MRVRSRLPDGTTGDVRLQFGGNRLAPEESGERQIQLLNSTYLQRGSQTLTFGVDNSLTHLRTWIPTDQLGLYEFASLADLDNGVSSRYSRQVPINGAQTRASQGVLDLGVFAQSEWRIGTGVTATAGLRYDVTSYMTGAPFNARVEQTLGLRTDNTPTDWNNLQPRIGLAWRLSDNWVIRAGSGLYFDLRTGQVAQSMFGNPPVYTRIDANCQRNVLCTLDQPDNWTYLDPGHKTGAVAFPVSPTEERAIQNVSPNTKTDNSLQYNLAIQRQLPKNMLVEMAYIGTKGTHLNGGENINPLIPVAGRDAPLFNGVQLRRTYAGFGDMTVVTQRGSSTYHSFQSTLKQRLNSTTFQLAYTFGKTLGDGDDSARYRVNTFASTPWNQYH
ncbi:MAG: TonB-dependent receptor, partial [Longimicrobiales bacterium]